MAKEHTVWGSLAEPYNTHRRPISGEHADTGTMNICRSREGGTDACEPGPAGGGWTTKYHR